MTNYFDEPINIEKMTILGIENTRAFAEISQKIYFYDEDNLDLKIFTEKQDNLKKTELLTIIDLIGLNLNSTSFLKIIYSDLEKQIKNNVETRSELEKNFIMIEEILKDEIVDFDLDLSIDSLNFQVLFKAMGVRTVDEGNSIYKKLLDIIEIISYVGKKKLIVFINSLSYLTDMEIKEVQRYISLNNLDILFLEPRKISGLSNYFCDNDYVMFKDMI